MWRSAPAPFLTQPGSAQLMASPPASPRVMDHKDRLDGCCFEPKFGRYDPENAMRCLSIVVTLVFMASCGESTQPPTPAKLAFVTAPASVTAGATLAPIRVAVQTDAGEVVTTDTRMVTVALVNAPPGATLTGTTSVAAVGGIATFTDLKLTRAAAGYALQASATGLTDATSGAFTVNAAVATQIRFTVNPSNTTAGTAFTPGVTVSVLDEFDNPSSLGPGDVTLALAANPVGGALAGTTVVTPVNGVAVFTDVRINKAGTGYALSATSGSLSVNSPSFDIAPAAAAKLVFLQTPGPAEAMDPIATVQVAVRDAFDNPVTTGSHSIFLTSNDATLYGTLTATSSAGVATFNNVMVDRHKVVALRANATGLTTGISGSFKVNVTYASLAADTAHTCALNTVGALFCWGTLGSGLGDGGTTSSTSPVLVPGFRFAQVSTGSSHTCGLTAAGGAMCWGAGGNSQIGDGGTTSRPTPVSVAGGYTFSALDAGWYHACAASATGPARCWGYNANAQLGDGTKTDRPAPVALSGDLSLASVGSGRYHSCGLTAAGAAFCWGSNARGQVGDDGALDDRTAPAVVSGGLVFTSIAAGGDADAGHTCALTNGGTAYCWGDNSRGQLGDGTNIMRKVPTLVSGGLTFASITVGSVHTCARTAAGVVYCWGGNDTSQLGDNSTTDRSVPVAITPSFLNFSAIAAGARHTCGIASEVAPVYNGVLWCWGSNSSGQLGLNSLVSAFAAPQPINRN